MASERRITEEQAERLMREDKIQSYVKDENGKVIVKRGMEVEAEHSFGQEK